MQEVTVVVHQDPDTGWWAESPQVPGWTAADPDLGELRRLISEGLAFFLDVDTVLVDERSDVRGPIGFELVGPFGTLTTSEAVAGQLTVIDGQTSLAPAGWSAGKATWAEPVSA